MLLGYCLSDIEMVPVAPTFDGITFAFISHMRWISVMRSLYFNIFSASFWIIFPSQRIATCFFLLSRILLPGLLLGLVLSVRTCWFHNVVNLTSWLVSTYFGTWSYPCLLCNFPPSSLHMLTCSWAQILSCLFMCCSFANMGHAWCYVFYCLIKLLKESASVICFCL
jgi:hypothetical protein